MKKLILVALVAAGFVASAPLTQAVQAAPPTNLVQTITLTLTYISQVNYTNASVPGQSEGFTNWDVLRTNKTARTTNVIDTYTTIYRAVTNRFVTKDVVAAINPDMAGGSLVLVTSVTDTNGNDQLEIRKGSAVYTVPNGTLYFNSSATARVGTEVVVTNTAYGRTNVTSTVTTSTKGYRVELGNLVLNTSTLSFNISGKAVETPQTVTASGNTITLHTTSASSLAGTGSDAAGFNEIVLGSVSVSAGKLEN